MNNYQRLMQILSIIGFDSNESLLYIKTLELGLSTVSKIAKNSDINRSTTYYLLYEMEKKETMNAKIINDILHFEAVSPEKLITLFEKKIREIEECKGVIQNNLEIFQKITTV